MSKEQKVGLTIGTIGLILILFVCGYSIAKYDTGSYAHVLYERGMRSFSNKKDFSAKSQSKNRENTISKVKNAVDKNSLADRLKKKLQNQNFSGEYAVIENGKVSGNNSIGAGVAPGKLYQVANTENILTAAAIVKLVDQGKITLTTPVSKFYSSLGLDKGVTVKSLLDMTSGIANDSVPNSQLQSGSDILQWNLNHAVVSSSNFGTYSNQEINYILLEGIVSQVSGMSYQAFISSNFFQPNGLNDIKFVNNLNIPEMATPLKNGQRVTDSNLSKQMNSQMGGNQVMASPSDYLRLIQILVREDSNKPGFISQNKTGRLTSTSDGYICADEIDGFKTAVKISKDGKTGVVLMSNDSNGNADEGNQLLEAIRNFD